ncbi:MAG: LysR family transcriptional regulator [Cyanobacteria bacterium CRU_2_1]|nr:LysR family transcriptional regulator [Cyanobacteria bacterium RU_5_0]NJR62060.1 LysR family transcriptional regulator [Cyanobacteria bacterium CRU_2_1]
MTIIHHINLAAIDLNLLVVFDALMTEHHVTRAGQKIGLSQPATSNALSRLRDLFDDELFVKTPDGMQPTPKAIVLSQPIHQILLQVQSALTHDTPFVPKTSDRLFTVGLSDYTEFVLLPKLLKHLETVAPKVRILVRSIDRHRGLKMLDADEIDLAIGVFPEHSSWHQKQVLFHEQHICVCRKDHSRIKEKIALEDYLGASHILVSVKEDMVGWIDEYLAQHNLKRHVAITVPHFLVAPFILANTDLIATLAERVAHTYADFLHLQVLPLPFEVSRFNVSMLWHSKNNNDRAHQWLRDAIAELN